jgi:heme-degrading monooxygenase HmoA
MFEPFLRKICRFQSTKFLHNSVLQHSDPNLRPCKHKFAPSYLPIFDFLTLFGKMLFRYISCKKKLLEERSYRMFARVSIIEGSPEQIEESIRFGREEAVPQAKKMRGFKGLYFLVDRKTGKEMAITLWETEADLHASAEAANRLREQTVQKIAAPPAKVEIYEVVEQP